MVNLVAGIAPHPAAIMFNLTRQQQLFLCTVMFFLVLGWVVKAWRTAHPPSARVVPVAESPSAAR